MTIETAHFTIEFTLAHLYLRTPLFETFVGRLGARGAWHIAWDGPKKLERLRGKQLARQQTGDAELDRLAA